MNIIEAMQHLKAGKTVTVTRPRKVTFSPYNFSQYACLSRMVGSFGLSDESFLADDWEVIQPPLSFAEAMKIVARGGKVTRVDKIKGVPFNYYYTLDKYDRLTIIPAHLSEMQATLDKLDIEATDWVEVT